MPVIVSPIAASPGRAVVLDCCCFGSLMIFLPIEIAKPVSRDAPLTDPGVRNCRTGLLRKRALETSPDTECQNPLPRQAGSVTPWSGSTWPVVSAFPVYASIVRFPHPSADSKSASGAMLLSRCLPRFSNGLPNTTATLGSFYWLGFEISDFAPDKKRLAWLGAQRLAHPRRVAKPEFTNGRCHPFDGAS
jgi:hypothetical protein